LDLAEPALARARDKAAAQGLSNVEFRVADIEHTGLASETFDAVVCVFGIFFLPDHGGRDGRTVAAGPPRRPAGGDVLGPAVDGPWRELLLG
jgi:hypothetical protein